ncbi:MAG: hypothetical protein JSU01_19255 [Bacteroidetes bacterium]|nr:hypothetical protein [Bacteroidota bacterium]
MELAELIAGIGAGLGTTLCARLVWHTNAINAAIPAALNFDKYHFIVLENLFDPLH